MNGCLPFRHLRVVPTAACRLEIENSSREDPGMKAGSVCGSLFLPLRPWLCAVPRACANVFDLLWKV